MIVLGYTDLFLVILCGSLTCFSAYVCNYCTLIRSSLDQVCLSCHAVNMTFLSYTAFNTACFVCPERICKCKNSLLI